MTKFILAPIGIAILLYFLWAFSLNEIDFSKWTYDSRSGLAFLWFCLSVLSEIGLTFIESEKKD